MEKLTIEAGQVWRRKPAGYLYKVEEVASAIDIAQSIKLQNLHDHRTSWISAAGLRKKFDLTDHGTVPADTVVSKNADNLTVVIAG
ncbi:hypothetical protein ACWGJ9_08055 [Curtobacterium citreum]